MATDFDRDDPIDRLLKGARRDKSGGLVAGPACLDAEVLGAWADGALAADERQSVETHVAGCARCQSLLAAFAISEDVAGSLAGTAPAVQAKAAGTVVPFRRSNVRVWLPIAAGTVAATLILWLGVRDREPAPAATVASSEIATPAPASSAPQAQTGDASAQLQAKADTTARDLESARGAQAKSAAASKPGQRLDALEETRARAEQSWDLSLARRAAEPAAAPPARPVASPGAAAILPPPAAMTAALPPPPPPPATPPPTPTPTPTPSVTVTSASPVVRQVGQTAESKAAANTVSFLPGATDPTAVLAQFSSLDAQAPAAFRTIPDRAAGAGRGGGRGGGGGGGAAAPTFRTGVTTLHWRIRASGQVERSTDAKTWELVRIDPPVEGLTGGTAPSPAVCWLIGRSGLVLLSTDSVQFNRVTSPTTANLTSIRATNALQATVTTADGQMFTTTDGGRTWKQLTTDN